MEIFLGLLLGYSFICRGLMGIAVFLTYAVKCSLFFFLPVAQSVKLLPLSAHLAQADSLITFLVLINKDLCNVSLFLSWALSDPTHSTMSE